MTCTTGDIVTIVEGIAPPSLAADWDNAGLQVGSTGTMLEAVLVSLDADVEVIAEAHERGAGLLVCHHPPIFRPLYRLLVDDSAVALLRDALTWGISIYAAHTSLDASPKGVNAALAALLQLRDQRPLENTSPGDRYKLVTFVPPEHVDTVSAALFRAGAGTIGDYTECSFHVEGKGTFVPGPFSSPAFGDIAVRNVAGESRLEMVVAGKDLSKALAALISSHPYEEPAYDVYYLHCPGGDGLGRVGDLPEAMTLMELARWCRESLGNPAVRVCGDTTARVSRIAVCGGSGGGVAPQALEAGAEVLVTGDVSHHQARDACASGLAIIDAGHYHTERPVVAHLASLLEAGTADAGLEVEVLVSEKDTNPWIYGGGD